VSGPNSTRLRLSAYFALVLVIFVMVGSIMFWKSSSKHKNALSNDTQINEVSFRLTLPGPWTANPTVDPSRRTYHTEAEQLTVSVFGSLFGVPGAMNHDEKSATFLRWVSKRRDAETKMPGFADVTVTEPTFGESEGTLAARYQGFDPARNRRFHCLILASQSAFEIFYYEGVGFSDAAAEDRAKSIFNTVDIPK